MGKPEADAVVVARSWFPLNQAAGRRLICPDCVTEAHILEITQVACTNWRLQYADAVRDRVLNLEIECAILRLGVLS